MQARKRQPTPISDPSLTPTPQEDVYDTAAKSQESSVRWMLGPDINASCFAERERARQVQILMVMLSRGFVFQPLVFGIDLLADFSR